MITYRKGDLLKSGVDCIVQQINAVTVNSHGLSHSIAKAFPYAEIYSKRKAVSAGLNRAQNRPKLGELILAENDEKSTELTELRFSPAVVGLVAQIAPGKPGSWTKQYQIDSKEDDAQARINAFEIFLVGRIDQWCSWIKDKGWKRIGLPFGIGCGLAAGDWSKYLHIIEEFSKLIQTAHADVVIEIWKFE